MRPDAALPPALRLAWLVSSLAVAAGTPTRAASAGPSTGPSAASSPSTGRLATDECAIRLDAAVQLAEEGDVAGAERRLERLAARCEHLPQIHHDLGVLAARDGRLPEAIAAFETSLAGDPRAAMTLEHLRALHRREAAAAYARALGTRAAAAPATLVLQDSADVNAEALREPADDGTLRSVITLEQTLFDWWLSSGARDEDAWLAHYDEGYPSALALAGRQVVAGMSWKLTHREIAFTAEDAVAVLEHGSGALAERRLLLLRLRGQRWKIYRETPL